MRKESTGELYTKEIENLAIESGLHELFLRRASVLLAEGKPAEAILEVKEGLANFPGNPAAYYFLIKLFLEIKKPKQAEITLNSAVKFFSSNELTAYYRELISETERELERSQRDEEAKLSRYSISEDPEEVIRSVDYETYEEENDEETFELSNDEPVENSASEDFFPDDEDTIANDYHKPENFVEETPSDETEAPLQKIEHTNDGAPEEIITAGMAIIYARQGNSEKAIEIFTRLIDKEPEKRESYEKIITLLKSKISRNDGEG